MAKELVEYSARLQAAVDKILINPAFSVQGGRRIRGRSTLTEQVASAPAGYSGYFKIVDASTTGNGTTTHKIRVVDGAGRGASICYINGQVFEVQDWESEAVASPMYVYLRFTLPKYDAEGMNTTPAAAEITMTENPQSADENYAWHQIGRLIFENNMMRIQQDFILGIMNLTVFGVECDG